MKRLLVLFFFLMPFILPAQQQQYNWNDKVQTIYESITSLRIPEARKLIAVEKLKNSDNLAYALLDSYADLYQLFFNVSKAEISFIYQTVAMM